MPLRTQSEGGALDDDDAFLADEEGADDGNEDDEDGEGPADLGDLFDAIEEDETLDADEKMRAMHALQGTFNLAAQAQVGVRARWGGGEGRAREPWRRR